jgi:two-component system NtrC family sensor kinase
LNEFANGGFPLRLGTRLTLYLSIIIIIVLSAYGYFHVMTRRDIFIRKMKVEVRSIAETLKVSLERTSLPREMEHVQELINAVGEYEKTLGILVYYRGKDLTFRSGSLIGGLEPYLESIKRSIDEDKPQEEFRTFGKTSIFSYSFPLKDRKGRNIGGVSILQHTSFMEEEIEKAEWDIFVIIFLLIGGVVTLILLGMRKWISQPISQLIDGIKNMAEGNLDTRINLKRGDELSELAQAFNQMAVDLKKAREKIVQESENKLELERSLRQSEKMATIGQFASGLAHEIGTPLNIIAGRAELMKRRLDDKEEAQKNLDIVVQQTERITKIIQQLLGFIRKKKPDRHALAIKAILRNTLDFLGHQIQKQGVSVAEEIKDSLPLISGDSDQLQQVFLNLILNAIQAMPEGGTLRVSVSSKRIAKENIEGTERQCLEVSIEDTGIGIEKEALSNIFNPFFTTKDRGTGLGLMVSQGIVQDHEGWINVESEVGKGSVFKVYLPSLQGAKDAG